jgi:hypothetical protein
VVDLQIINYANSEFFSGTFYIFNRRNIFEKQMEVLKEILEAESSASQKNLIETKIILLLKEDLLESSLNFSEDVLFVKNKIRIFRDVFVVENPSPENGNSSPTKTPLKPLEALRRFFMPS